MIKENTNIKVGWFKAKNITSSKLDLESLMINLKSGLQVKAGQMYSLTF
jgi:hypothetical protein